MLGALGGVPSTARAGGRQLSPGRSGVSQTGARAPD